jgi:TRAP-type C4-dicarboxylate transport system substrate-binding protein
MKRQLAFGAAALMLLGGMATALAPAALAQEKYVLRAVTFLPVDRAKMKIKGVTLVERINKAAAEKYPGELRISIVGGPEVIPSGDQPIAVRTGTVDMALTCASFYQGLVPVGDILLLSSVSLDDERRNGALAYVRELHEKAGLYALGRMDGTRAPFFFLATRKPVTKPGDLQGLRAGSISLFAEAWARALGMSFQVVPFGDTYTAMEHGVIDVYMNALDTQAAAGLSKLKGYAVVDHPAYVDNCLAILNLNKWRSLPPHLQKLMQDVQQEVEVSAGNQMTEFNAAERKKLVDAGVTFVQFSPADARKFVDTAYAAQWEKMLKLQPEIATRLKTMLSK